MTSGCVFDPEVPGGGKVGKRHKEGEGKGVSGKNNWGVGPEVEASEVHRKSETTGLLR